MKEQINLMDAIVGNIAKAEKHLTLKEIISCLDFVKDELRKKLELDEAKARRERALNGDSAQLIFPSSGLGMIVGR